MRKKLKDGIIIFAYNRPSHLRRLLISLEDYNIKKANIFIDGPKNYKDKICQKEIEFMLKTNKKISFNIYKNKKNIGLARSLLKGIDKMSKKFENLIILEDDCVPRKEFFPFLKKAFKIYGFRNDIGAICGYQLPDLHKQKNQNIEAKIYSHFIPWGWGIFSNKWERFRSAKFNCDSFFKNKTISLNIRRIIKTSMNSKNFWTPLFVIYNYLFNCKFIFPSKCLVKNIGFDGSGENSKYTNKFNTYYTPSKNIFLKKNIKIDVKEDKKQEKILNRLIKYYY